jgi:uncharacterized protein (DUF58 family)
MIQRRLYNLFNFFERKKNGFLERFTPAGRLVVAGAVAAGLFGVNPRLNMAFQVFCLLSALLIASGLYALRFKAAFTARRNAPRYGTAGRPLTYRVRVENATRRLQKGLRLAESPPQKPPTFEEFMTRREPLGEKRNAFDRYVGYHRFLYLLHLNQRAVVEENDLPDLAPRSTAEVKLTLTPTRRGRLDLKGLKVIRTDPLGLIRSKREIEAADRVLILPQRYQLPASTMPGTRRFQPGGVALAGSVGDAEEFVSLRDYQPGDPLRRIHWRSWARLGKPIVKEFQEEFFVRHALILDTFHPVPGAPIFEEAVRLAASFVAALDDRESLLDLMFVGPEAYCFTSGRGLSQVDRMLEILASVDVCADRSFEALKPVVLERAGLLSACILVLLDWDEPRRALVSDLIALNLPLTVLAVTPPGFEETLDPGPMTARPGRFHQLETGRVEAQLSRL